MNKKLAILLSSLLLGGFASAQEQAAPATAMPAAAAACEAKGACATTTACKKTQAVCTSATSACAKEEVKKECCHNVLTPEERHRFCEVKNKVIAANPELAKKGQKHALCDAILKEDPSMKPILDKLREHCKQMNRKMGKTMRSINEATTAPAAQ